MLKFAGITLAFTVYLLLRQCGVPPSASAPLGASAVLPTPAVLPSDAVPKILAVQMSDDVLHSGEMVSGTIVTSTNVTDVAVNLAGRTGHIPQASPGIFRMVYRLPNIPFFLRGRYTAHITATNAQGASAQRDITVLLR